MADTCAHLDRVAAVRPSSSGCEDCLRVGGQWMHLRLCMTCGHVGCCDNSPNRHATAHWRTALFCSGVHGSGLSGSGPGSIGVPEPSNLCSASLARNAAARYAVRAWSWRRW